MNKISEIIEKVKACFSGIHVEIEKHSPQGKEYEISCYGLNENLFDKAYDFVFDLNSNLKNDSAMELIPIFYTREETTHHFPQIHVMLLEESMLEPILIPRSAEIDLSFDKPDLDMCFCHSIQPVNIINSVSLIDHSIKGVDVLSESTGIDYSLAA